MRRIVLVLAVLVVASAAVGTVARADTGRRAYRGKDVDLDFKAAPIPDLMRLFADVGRVNIVLVDVAVPPLDIKVKRVPWDKVFDDVVTRSKLAHHRMGNTIVVGKPDVIAELQKVKRRGYKGKIVDLWLNNAGADDAAWLLSVATKTKRAIVADGPRTSTVRLMHVRADQAAELVALQTGATVAPRTIAVLGLAGCQARETPRAQVRLAGIVQQGIKRWALFVVPGSDSHILTKGDCIGSESAKITDVGPGYVSFDVAGTEVNVPLFPAPP